jgi:hypothetical protein
MQYRLNGTGFELLGGLAITGGCQLQYCLLRMSRFGDRPVSFIARDTSSVFLLIDDTLGTCTPVKLLGCFAKFGILGVSAVTVDWAIREEKLLQLFALENGASYTVFSGNFDKFYPQFQYSIFSPHSVCLYSTKISKL